MTGRRRRTGDEFADERRWTADEQSGYQRPGGAGPADPPWPRQDAADYGTDAFGLPSGSRHGRHSAAPDPPGPAGDPYARPADRGQAARPPAGSPAAGPPPRPPRQPGPQVRHDPQPDQYGAPTARFPAQRGGYPAGSSPYPGEASRYPGPGDRRSAPGDGYPAPGAQSSVPGGRPSVPGDGYPAPGAQSSVPGGRPSVPGGRPSAPGDRYSPGRDQHDGSADRYQGATDQFPESGNPGRPARGGRYPAAGHGARPGARFEPRDEYGARDDHGTRDDYDGRDDHDGRDDYDGHGGRGDDFDGFWASDDRDPAGRRDGRDSGDDRDDRRVRPRRRRRGRVAALIAVLVIVVPLAVGAFFVYHVIAGKFFPADYSGPGTGQVVVQVKPGDTATAVGDRLFTLGVVASARAFVLAAEHSSNSSGLQPGFYRMHKQMNATLAFNLLLKPSARIQVTVTIPEGLRISQILTALGHDSGIPPADYQQALRHPGALGLPSYAHGNPEGYLFPATYSVQPGMTAASVLQTMVKSFSQEAASVNLTQAAARVHLTPAQVIVVASLAQAEGGKLSDFPKITRVIYNRLAAGMPLQLDSTVLYALHTYGILASNQQLNVNSPYNTYRNKGLPPGPIDSPGDAAIRAALHPASGNWLYFVTVNPKTKQTDFTSSPTVFNQLRAELARNLGQGG